MVRNFVTDKSITLFWEPDWERREKVIYRVLVDGKLVGKTAKTHYTLLNLEANRGYDIQIEVILGVVVIGEKNCSMIYTAMEKKRRDITHAPYHAVGDGNVLNTKVLQQAIDDCGSDEVLYIPAGTYLTGALRLHSDMEVYLEEGAVLQGTDRPEDYLPRIPSRFEGYEMECYSSLINMGHLDKESDHNCRNVMIHGKGSIVGGGLALATNIVELERVYLQDMLKELGEGIKEYETADTIPGRVRPRLVNMSNCQNIILSGIHFADGPCWNIHMIYSDNIVTHNCTVKSRGVWNGDGWDPDSSTNCTIFGTTFYTGDDAIAIKSGKNPEGNIINRPCEHIRIFDCVSKFGHGIAMGSEMSGGIRDVKIWDCDMGNTKYGIEIKGTKKRGSFVRDVHVRDCKVSRILFHSVGYNDDGIGVECPPLFADCSFENLHILGEYLSMEDEVVPCDAFELIGFDEKGYEIQNVVFKDILMQREVNDGVQSLSLQHCKNITLQNVEVRENKENGYNALKKGANRMTKPRILLSAVSEKENYEEAVRACGGIPIMEYKPEEMATYDGLILCGGNDINPAYYGEEIAGSVDIDYQRDEAEIAIAKEFIKARKPIMGICRGYQLINILLGGSLYQHLETTDNHRAGNGDDAIHLVIAEKGSIVEKLYGTKFVTNSYHHQAVKQLGKNLIITARAEDGTVEAFEHESLPIFGVQWHPDRMCCNHKREDTVDGKTFFQFFMNTII